MKILKYGLLSFLLIIFILNIDIVMESIIDGSILFFNKVFVCIFPFTILSSILINYDYHIFLKNIFGKLFNKLFNINPNSSLIIILSILTSEPSNSIYINDMLDKKIININEANKVLSFTYFPSIAFSVGVIGIKLYGSFKIGFILLLNNYLCNICLGLFLRRNKCLNISNNYIQNKESFFSLIKSSIMKGINTSFIILGNICIFTIIINFIKHYFNFNPILLSIINGLLELNSSVNYISLLNISLKLKLVLTSFALNFSGISIIFQSICILDKYKINIKKLIFIKLIFSIMFSLLFLLY